MKVLLVEDNERLAERISYKLKDYFVVDSVSTGQDAIKKILKINYSVILLDLMLPDVIGLDVCKIVRKNNINTPILILTGVGNLLSKIELLDSGADDYVTKPFDINELRARITALSRRQARQKLAPKLQYKNILIDTNEHKVYINEQEILLRRKEFDILHYLIQNQGRVLTRKMIMDHVWNHDSTSWVTTVDVHIKHIRDKVDRPFGTDHIKTAYGLGYKVEAA